MPENKGITIDMKVASKGAIADFKRLNAEAEKGVFSKKAQKETTAFWDRILKSVVKMAGLTKEQGKLFEVQGKAYKQHILAPMQEREKIEERQERRLRNAVRRSVSGNWNNTGVSWATAVGARWQNRQDLGVYPFNTGRPMPMIDGRPVTGNDIADMARNRTQAHVQIGLADQMRAQEQRAAEIGERQQKYNRMASYATAFGVATQVAGEALSTFGNVAYGQREKELKYSGQAAQFAGKLYEDARTGDFTTMYGMLNAKGPTGAKGMALFREMMSDAGMRSGLNEWGSYGSAVGKSIVGTAQAALGTSLMVGTGGLAAGVGGLNVTQGVGGAVGGGIDLAERIAEYNAGRRQAELSDAGLRAANYMRNLDPIKLQQLSELQTMIPHLADLGNLSSGFSPNKVATQIAIAGGKGGIQSYQESKGYFDLLREQTSQATAEKDLEHVTRAPELYGIGRQYGASAMGALATGAGGNERAKKEMFDLFSSATLKGLNDSKIREGIVTTLPALMTGYGSRAASLTGANQLMDLAKEQAAAGGRAGPDLTDLRTALQGLMSNQQATTTNTGIAPWDVANWTSDQGALGKLSKKMGKRLTPTARKQISLDIGQLSNEALDTEAGKGYLRKQGLSEEEANEFINDLRTGRAQSPGRSMGTMAGDEYELALRMPGGLTDANIAKARSILKPAMVVSEKTQKALKGATETLFPPPLVPGGTSTGREGVIDWENAMKPPEVQGTMGRNKDQRETTEAAQKIASTKLINTIEALNNPDMQRNLVGSVEALSAFAQAAADASREGRLDALKNAAVDIGKASDAWKEFMGVVMDMLDPTGGHAPKPPQDPTQPK
jgi:hypothetical protein